ncbi:MAG: hypothetical protein QXP81_08665 [Nitrososphaerota archaeon]
MREDVNNDPAFVTWEQFMALEARVDAIEKDIATIKTSLRHLEEDMKELRMEIRRLDAKIDRFFWLWVSTIAVAVLMRVFGLV